MQRLWSGVCNWMKLRWEVPTEPESECVAAEVCAPPGMYPTRKSTSVPDLLRRLRSRRLHVPMPSTAEEMYGSGAGLARVLVQARCRLAMSAREEAVGVIVQYLRSDTSDYLKIFRKKRCVLHLDRRLLRFVENADRLELAFNSKTREYDWWVLKFDVKHMHSYYSMHYHLLMDATL
jgi:hypothetical protein